MEKSTINQLVKIVKPIRLKIQNDSMLLAQTSALTRMRTRAHPGITIFSHIHIAFSPRLELNKEEWTNQKRLKRY